MLDKTPTAVKPKVSVCIITYNHELYVRKCLEGIFSQKCNFEFEVVVRDDCSQDKTAEIIKNFRDKFPQKVKLLDGSLNLGANSNLLAVLGAAAGEYIAICEGDDYWINNYKIQKQVDVMDDDPCIKFTAHPCRIHDEDGLQKPFFVKASNVIGIDCNDVLRVPGQFAPTASYMFRKEVIAKLPDWFKDAPVGDFFLEMYALSMGSGRYLPEPMSAYRTFSLNSWSSSNTGNSGAARLKNSLAMIYFLSKMRDEDPFRKYDFSSKMGAVYFNVSIACLLLRDFAGFRQAIVKCKLEQTHFTVKQKMFYYARKMPRLASFVYRMKLRLHS